MRSVNNQDKRNKGTTSNSRVCKTNMNKAIKRHETETNILFQKLVLPFPNLLYHPSSTHLPQTALPS